MQQQFETATRWVGLAAMSLLLASATLLRAENWPNWRGPSFNGASPEHNLPVTADTLFATLDLNFGFAALSLGSVYRLSNVTP